MELIQNSNESSQSIVSVTSQQVTVDETNYQESVIVCNQLTVKDLNLNAVQQLQEWHVQALLDSKPEVILFGSGESHQFPDPSLLTAIAKTEIGFEVMTNQAAARTYNILVAEERKVACLLIL